MTGEELKAYNRERMRQWRANNKEKEREKHRRWRRKNPEKNAAKKWRWRLKHYGITQAQYELMLATQGSVCAICGTSIVSETMNNFCVDHDHKTGKVRGLLCANCNFVLGNARDDYRILLRAIDYLLRCANDPERNIADSLQV